MTNATEWGEDYWKGRRDERERVLKIIAEKQHNPMNNGVLVTLYRKIREVPIDELEAVLNKPEPQNIRVNQDGTVSKVKRKSREKRAAE